MCMSQPHGLLQQHRFHPLRARQSQLDSQTTPGRPWQPGRTEYNRPLDPTANGTRYIDRLHLFQPAWPMRWWYIVTSVPNTVTIVR